MAFAEQGPYRCPISRRGLPKGCQDRADQGLQSSFQAEPGLWIRTTPYHPGPATTVFGTVVRLEDSDNSGSRKPRSEAVFGQRPVECCSLEDKIPGHRPVSCYLSGKRPDKGGARGENAVSGARNARAWTPSATARPRLLRPG